MEISVMLSLDTSVFKASPFLYRRNLLRNSGFPTDLITSFENIFHRQTEKSEFSHRLILHHVL